jgi:hypothetical protein
MDRIESDPRFVHDLQQRVVLDWLRDRGLRLAPAWARDNLRSKAMFFDEAHSRFIE